MAGIKDWAGGEVGEEEAAVFGLDYWGEVLGYALNFHLGRR